tara:strand:+ start:325 stop:459 length:135 start_codon:yes stop_codon:yes gene_type:complete
MLLRKLERLLLLRIELHCTGRVLLDRDRGIMFSYQEKQKKFPQI